MSLDFSLPAHKVSSSITNIKICHLRSFLNIFLFFIIMVIVLIVKNIWKIKYKEENKNYNPKSINYYLLVFWFILFYYFCKYVFCMLEIILYHLYAAYFI